MTDLLTALEAMDQLNRWVRFRGASRPRKAVYWLKSRYAIRDAIMAGLTARVRLVEATVKCTRCTKGVYHDWEGRDRGRCYHCDGKGTARLKFVETQIADSHRRPCAAFTWHTPVSYQSWLGWPMEDLTPEPTNDWLPLQPGIELPIEEAARLLNVVESYWTAWQKDSGPYDVGYEEWDSTRYYLFNYIFELPSDGEAACRICGGEFSHRCHTVIAPLFEQSVAVCKQCGDRPKIFDEIKRLPLPKIIDHPEIATWRNRHLEIFKSIWESRWKKPWEEAA
jgi:hypothetical protein